GGAIVADLLMQLFGVAALALVLPPAIWGWRLVSHRPLRREGIRLLVWLVGLVLAAGFAALLPRSATWPLPAGLGGVIRDWLLRLPAMLAGGTLAGMVRLSVAVVLGTATLVCFAIAAGFGWRDDADEKDEPAEEEDEEKEERTSISLGWITHEFLSLKARLG